MIRCAPENKGVRMTVPPCRHREGRGLWYCRNYPRSNVGSGYTNRYPVIIINVVAVLMEGKLLYNTIVDPLFLELSVPELAVM